MCGPETKILPPFINFANGWRKSYKGLNDDLKNAYLKEDLIDSAIVDFVSHIMLNRGLNSKRACAKDPDIVLNTEYLQRIFPNAKIIYMIRDGRAAAYSYMVFIYLFIALKLYFLVKIIEFRHRSFLCLPKIY